MKLKNRENRKNKIVCSSYYYYNTVRSIYFYFTILFLTITLLAIEKIQSNNTTIKKTRIFIYFDIFGYCICRFIYFKIPLENKQIETKQYNTKCETKRRCFQSDRICK